jgi:glycosyltransferase involved in cell wall biosynthesis
MHPDNKNVPENQRATLLAENFRTAILCRSYIPDTIREKCQEAYRIKGRALFVLHGFLLILYLRVIKGYKVVYSSREILTLVWGLSAKWFLGCKWIIDLCDHPSLEFASGRPGVTPAKKFFYEAFLRDKLTDADAWIVGMHKGILDHMPKPYPESKILQITNGVDLSLIERVLEHRVRPHESPTSNVVAVCYAGPISLLRGMSVMLEWLQLLSAEYSIKVDLFGEGYDEVLKAIRNHNRSSPHKVHYHGYLPHEVALAKIAESEVCLCIVDPSVLSFDYAYAVKIFEYLAMGKVVVASHTIASAQIIRHGENGFLITYSAKDLKSIFDTILSMRESGDLLRVKRAARETARLYLWEDINKRTLLFLKALWKDV